MESLAYGAAGIFFLCAGAGRYSVDARLASWMATRGPRAQRLAPYLWASPGRRSTNTRRPTLPAMGQVYFRLFIGSLLILHAVSQVTGRGNRASMAELSAKIGGRGLPLPTIVAWATTLTMLAVGVILGLTARAGGVALAVAAAVLLISVPSLAGTNADGYGFDGEELFFLTSVGVFYALTGAGIWSAAVRPQRPRPTPGGGPDRAGESG